MDNLVEGIPPERIFKAMDIPCELRHGLILRLWDRLAVGEWFVLENDHDPAPLRRQFERLYGDTFAWERLEHGPEKFRIRITRLREKSPGAGNDRASATELGRTSDPS